MGNIRNQPIHESQIVANGLAISSTRRQIFLAVSERPHSQSITAQAQLSLLAGRRHLYSGAKGFDLEAL